MMAKSLKARIYTYLPASERKQVCLQMGLTLNKEKKMIVAKLVKLLAGVNQNAEVQLIVWDANRECDPGFHSTDITFQIGTFQSGEQTVYLQGGGVLEEVALEYDDDEDDEEKNASSGSMTNFNTKEIE